MSIWEKAAVLLFALTLLTAIFLWRTSAILVRFENGAVVHVELAKEPMSITTGLMFRGELPRGRGMLFSYGYDDYHSIWMKNMRFPIDIIWIDSSSNIVSLARDVKPCIREPCPVYRPSKKARYVLEVNANFTLENRVAIGQKVVIHQPSLF
jgi:hypothetical protein